MAKEEIDNSGAKSMLNIKEVDELLLAGIKKMRFESEKKPTKESRYKNMPPIIRLICWGGYVFKETNRIESNLKKKYSEINEYPKNKSDNFEGQQENIIKYSLSHSFVKYFLEESMSIIKILKFKNNSEENKSKLLDMAEKIISLNEIVFKKSEVKISCCREIDESLFVDFIISVFIKMAEDLRANKDIEELMGSLRATADFLDKAGLRHLWLSNKIKI